MVEHLFLPGDDPWEHLALEEALFDSLPEGGVRLLLYVNRPCLVMGKHQNPVREVRFEALRARGWPLLRRFSGGGTVWHDQGNLNWSLSARSERFDKDALLALVAEALASLGLAAEVRAPGDVLVEGFKVSGTASQVRRDRSLLHGTLLCAADLASLHGVLGPTGQTLHFVGVASRPQPVANLGVRVKAAAAALVGAFERRFGAASALEPTPADAERAASYGEQLRSRAWLWDRTPPFEWQGDTKLGPLRVKVADGKIVEAHPGRDDEKAILSKILGMTFFSSDVFDLFD